MLEETTASIFIVEVKTRLYLSPMHRYGEYNILHILSGQEYECAFASWNTRMALQANIQPHLTINGDKN
jgi:hypothetical protein